MSTAPALPAVTTAHRAARVSTFAGFGIQGLLFASLITRLPTIKDRFDLSDYEVLAVLGAVAVASAVGSVIAGYASARFGSGVVLRLTLAASAGFVVLIAVSGDLPVLVATCCGYGLCVGAIDATTNMQGVGVQDLYGRSIMVGFHGMWSAGAVVGGVYATITLELDWALLPSLLAVAVAAVVLNAVLCRNLLRHDPVDGHAETIAEAVHVTVPWWPVLLLAVPTFAMWFLDASTSAWGGIYLTDGLHASDSAGPLAFTAYQALLLLTRLFGDAVVRRFGAVTTIRASGAVAVLALVLIVAAPTVGLAVVGFGVLGAGVAMVPPLSMVAAGHLDGGGGQALARVNVSNYVGYLVAALGIALVAELISHRAMFLPPLLVAPVLILMATQFRPRTGAAR
ncbi:MFS transporter [Nocardioides panacisoli]|uniref:MFS transporter n=1 Tax=Nocardioides panacisoli TaxID=627624 RepID=A0ABP7J7U4_9ACTN